MDKKKDEMINPSNPVMELFTVADLKDGGYERHYRSNVKSDPENKYEDSKAEKIYDIKKAEFTEPFYKCPSCDGPNLYRSLHENYYECDDCDFIGSKESLKIKYKNSP